MSPQQQAKRAQRRAAISLALAGALMSLLLLSVSSVTAKRIKSEVLKLTGLPTTFAISGNVKADAVNLAGATVALSGSQSALTTTDASGNYSITANSGGNYSVSVYKNGSSFNPASQAFNNLQANQTANFQNGNSPRQL